MQARMGSARLPNKMMLWLHGFPVIFWIFHRLSKSKILSKIVFALPATDANIGLAYYIKSFGGNVFEGSEYNVLERFYDAAQANSADIVVRVCGDNPFVCGREIDRLINFYETSNLDYAYNHAPIGNSYPGARIIEKHSMYDKSPPGNEHYHAPVPISAACSAKPTGFFLCQRQLSLHISSRPSEARQDKNFSANCVSANDTAASPTRLSTTSKGIFTLFMFSKVRRTSNTE